MPLLTIALFVVLELLLNNVMEPLLYGANTGVSSIALIVAAVFWTWLWGPLGLVLATPLTVCLVVMGRHVPRLSFLSVVLSDEEALTPAEDCYHRLLTPGERDELELVESYLKANSLTALYDCGFHPGAHRRGDRCPRGTAGSGAAQSTSSKACATSSKTSARARRCRQGGRGKADWPRRRDGAAPPALAPDCRVFCLPARADRDELAGAMLVQLARQQGFGAQNAPAKLVDGRVAHAGRKRRTWMSSASRSWRLRTVIHARYLCLKLRALLPKQKIVIGLWGATEELTEAAKRLRDSGADEVVTTLAEALVQMARLAPPMIDEMTPAPIPADEEKRLAALD